MIQIKLSEDKRLTPFAPTKAYSNAAAWDLYCAKECTILPRCTRLIQTGVHVIIPDGMVGMVCSRSGLALKFNVFVLNAPGIIDPDYRGEVGVILHNLGPTVHIVQVGERVGQLLICPVAKESYQLSCISPEEFDAQRTDRGSGGFGSSGQ